MFTINRRRRGARSPISGVRAQTFESAHRYFENGTGISFSEGLKKGQGKKGRNSVKDSCEAERRRPEFFPIIVFDGDLFIDCPFSAQEALLPLATGHERSNFYRGRMQKNPIFIS